MALKTAVVTMLCNKHMGKDWNMEFKKRKQFDGKFHGYHQKGALCFILGNVICTIEERDILRNLLIKAVNGKQID